MSDDALKIIGANGKRRPMDFYPTPPDVTVALVDWLESRCGMRKGQTVWEPACGDFAISRVLEGRGYSVISSDILRGQDFIDWQPEGSFDWIITNPPFCKADDFIRRAALFGKPFAMLLKSQYWHSTRRFQLFEGLPPSFVCPLTWRPDFTGKGASMMDVMWCVWLLEPDYTIYRPLQRPGRRSHD